MASPTETAAQGPGPAQPGGVLRAAVALVDDSGLKSLTMRRLGEAVGVEAMSLYNHVAGKDDSTAWSTSSSARSTCPAADRTGRRPCGSGAISAS